MKVCVEFHSLLAWIAAACLLATTVYALLAIARNKGFYELRDGHRYIFQVRRGKFRALFPFSLGAAKGFSFVDHFDVHSCSVPRCGEADLA